MQSQRREMLDILYLKLTSLLIFYSYMIYNKSTQLENSKSPYCFYILSFYRCHLEKMGSITTSFLCSTHYDFLLPSFNLAYITEAWWGISIDTCLPILDTYPGVVTVFALVYSFFHSILCLWHLFVLFLLQTHYYFHH